jgi:hypothetical protein
MKARRAVQKSRKLSSLDIARAMNWNPIALHRRQPHVWASGTIVSDKHQL